MKDSLIHRLEAYYNGKLCIKSDYMGTSQEAAVLSIQASSCLCAKNDVKLKEDIAFLDALLLPLDLTFTVDECFPETPEMFLDNYVSSNSTLYLRGATGICIQCLRKKHIKATCLEELDLKLTALGF